MNIPHSIVDQVRMAFQKQNRYAMGAAFVLGGFVPAAIFFLVHYGVTVNPWLWSIVAGGLIFSAKTVYVWGCDAFNSKLKAFGFCVLVEGVMTFSPPGLFVLSIAGLAMLTIINGVATGCNLALNSKECNAARRAASREAKPKPAPLPAPEQRQRRKSIRMPRQRRTAAKRKAA